MAADWVLTARHCAQGGTLRFELPEDEHGPLAGFDAVATVVHEVQDALLLRIDRPPATPIPILADPVDRSWIGAPVQLAGYGMTENGQPANELRFLIERVSELDEQALVVAGHGRSGACAGDSGGPLLARDLRGRLVVGGILASGSASCLHNDRYVRADVLTAWAEGQIDRWPIVEPGCGELTAVGFCRRGVAIWCDGGRIVAESCAGTSACGFSSAAAGYRCVQPGVDSCDGVDDLGTCRDGAAVRCVDGAITEQNCGRCGPACGWDATQGRAACVGAGPGI